MSAEVLREAATSIRAMHGNADRFMAAVADWLVSVYCATTGEWVDDYTCAGPVGESEKASALAVARAYLAAPS